MMGANAEAAGASGQARGRWPAPRRLEELTPTERDWILHRGTVDRDEDDEDAVEATVRAILEDVRTGGDSAVAAHSERLDGVVPPRMLLGPEDFQAALDELDPALRRAMERAANNLRKVAEATRVDAPHRVEVEPGLVVEEYETPLARVGAYVPGGKAAYPSSVLMAAVPARAAGVREIIVASPPGPDGRRPGPVLAACALAGVDRCLVAGGAQAIAALAYGTRSVPAVDKIVGPGNRYVTAAKRLVYGRVDIDSPAGPTEVLILADASADPARVAADMVAQAEHGEDSACILVTTSPALASDVALEIATQTQQAKRRQIVAAALRTHGAILIAEKRTAATTFARQYAPEHLQVMTKDPEAWAAEVPTAATTFLGMDAPVPVGDYLTGANHVLPTGLAARWAAPLSVHSFRVRRTSQSLTPAAAAALVDDLEVFARAEGLHAHADSMIMRRRKAA